VVLINNNTVKKNYTKRKIDRAWCGRLVRHPARKRSGSILTTPEPAKEMITTTIDSTSSRPPFYSHSIAIRPCFDHSTTWAAALRPKEINRCAWLRLAD